QGFEYQVRSIIGQVRPARQTLLFSATFKRRIERLAADILTDPVRINVGGSGGAGHQLTANEDVRQVVAVVPDDACKWSWLRDRLSGFVAAGKVLVFVSSKQGCEELCTSIAANGKGVTAGAIHGDKDQSERERVLRAFKHSQLQVLVGTDVASRGLDIKDVNTVVNYDAAKSIETHVHRVGRTGRMTKDGVHPGTAYTLVTPKQAAFAADLLRHLEAARQEIPSELRTVAGGVHRRGGSGGGSVGFGGCGSGGGGGSSRSGGGGGGYGGGPSSSDGGGIATGGGSASFGWNIAAPAHAAAGAAPQPPHHQAPHPGFPHPPLLPASGFGNGAAAGGAGAGAG
ncbi:unnamed protein product, partial [Phaeothamnion confervicola]